MTLIVPDFRNARVLVAGDVMLDRYWHGPAGRISPEAPVPVVRVEDIEERPGGGANVAMNLASLGVTTRLLGLTGDDEPARRLEALVEAAGVATHLERMASCTTTTKLRVLSRNQQLIRLDFENDASRFPAGALDGLFAAHLADVGMVVLSDYGKGSLNGIETQIAAARAAGATVLVDPKGADFERYRRASGITPNLAEFEAVVGRCGDESVFEARGEELRASLELDFLLVTRSERGMSLFSAADGIVHLPAAAREVYDVTGAGDTVIAVTAAGLAAGLPVRRAAALANLASGLVVGKLGVASVTPEELRLELHRRGTGGRGFMAEDALVEAVRQCQARGERVVMTNGCFDILHAGHISYLEEAKSLGDRLVVAVNDDDTVRRLKGDGRPINRLADRLAVLSGLAAVDWVVPFSGDTPERLISRVLPDVLVKGGDYRPEDIAGRTSVLANGGEVRVLGYRDGRSTSAIVERIRGRTADDT
jgi:D-beta-D-heptose 7-phosphate kinase/D-beta-D-heptose 1-phosphate adenosyltransferase